MATDRKKILIADDEERIVSLISDFLRSAGYETVSAYNGAEALRIFRTERDIALIILDIMMPELNGWEVTREIRKESAVPVIMLSARSEEFDLLTGFDAGADEYVTKPFSPAVLVKRVEALLKRAEGKAADTPHGLVIDRAAYTAALDGRPLDLTLKEFELLCCLHDHAGMVLSRDRLLDLVWGYDFMGDSRTVDSHIARLRIKLGDYGASRLKTVYGMGYKLEHEE